MTILDEIIANKKKELLERKAKYPTRFLEQSDHFGLATRSLRQHVLSTDRSGIIAEIKRKSPSKGVIHSNVNVEEIAIGYEQAGVSGLSILTDSHYFGGTNDDLTMARNLVGCPILRKEFIIDEYQIIEARSIGADAILLIAAALPPLQLRQLRQFAQSLQLEVLLEVHNEEELKESLDAAPDLMGVNNRNLKTFEVDINISKRLGPLIPDSMTRVSESGIESVEAILDLSDYGFKGFLIGQRFMETAKPEAAAKNFIQALALAKNQSR